ncbi:MAG: DNA repair protein RecO [Candidatus Puniceispirillaceae bacterium]
MPEWRDEGMVLGVRAHGESHAVISVLTAEHGRHAGLVHAGQSRAKKAVLELGNQLQLDWQARLAEQLGTFRVELLRNRAALLLDNPMRLAALGAVCGLLDAALPEREPQSALFDSTNALMDILAFAEADQDWLPFFVRWEWQLLATTGFAPDLSVCAVTGARNGLAFISPRTGNAVTPAGAGPYKERLLALPEMLGGAMPVENEIEAGLKITAHFLGKHIFHPMDKDLPAPRLRLQDLAIAYLVGSR